MSPAIRDGETVYLTPTPQTGLRCGDIVLVKSAHGFRLHRLIRMDPVRDLFITRGDCGQQDDPPVAREQIFGVVVAKDVFLGNRLVRARLRGIGGRLLQIAARTQSIAIKAARRVGSRRRRGRQSTRTAVQKILCLLAPLFFLLAVPFAQGQVAVDADPSTSGSADLVGAGAQTLTFDHTTSATANRALLVGVSMNITNAPATTVSGITYNGTGLTFVGAQNDTSNTRRVELWWLLNPASGTNLPIIVSVNVSAAATVGVVAGATIFTDVDQTVPLGTFASSDGEYTGCVASTATGNDTQCNSLINVSSVVNGMVFDTVTVGLGAIAANSPQVTQWDVASGGADPNAIQDVTGITSTRAGAPSIPDVTVFNNALTLTKATADALGLNLTSVVPNATTLTLSAAANAAGGDTIYTGTITGGAGNAYRGATVVVTGFTNGNNNGTFTCTASTTTTLTLNNANGVAQTQAAKAAVTTSTTYDGTITGGAGNAYNGDAVVISGFTNAGNNGTFTISASSATSITVNNIASIAETDPGTAIISTGTSTVYTGTITGGISNGYAGDSFTIAGFTSAADNGTFTCTASTPTTLTCSNTAGVTQTHAGTATTNATFNWAEGAISLNPSTADIGVTTTTATVFVGQNTTYTTTVFNNGPSPANTPSLTLTWPASLTVVSLTPSSGTSCPNTPPITPPITCTLPSPFTSSMTATVTLVVMAATSGAYASTATVTDSGTPPDPNTGNNTYTAVATVQAVSCGTVTQAAPGTNLTGVLNTYYPGTASVAAGATAIPVGTPTGAGAAIAAGNLLLVIQMQDASINDTNSVLYGNGSTGQGFTALNSVGDYEFVTATGAITGGSVPIQGAGVGGGLVFAYHDSAASATAGQSTYQVIIVPQYTTASFSATSPPTALAWNGSTGGVFTIDTSDTLTLNGATVVVDGLGFRGGAGMQLTGGTGNATDFLHSSPATYTGAAEAGVDGPKGEGIAGTPMWVESGGTYLQTNTTEGYPNPAGGDGSMARGAPGNAGGGATDPDPGANDQNAGGGGGGNGGAGGFGGNSWSSNQSTGGEGGVAFPATVNRIAMGGGGGAGDRNNSNGDTQASGGSTGGGIIIIRTWQLSGTGTLTANGINAYNGTANDGGGGGGAGGTIVILSANGGEGGLTLSANGGTGGDAWASESYTWGNRHGPGGGGGGGIIFVSGTPAQANTNGGANGTTENPGVPYGSTPGTGGWSVTNASIASTSGTQSGAECTPDMTLGKSHVGSFTRGLTATYTIPVSNVSPYGPSSGTVTVNDTLPVGLTPTSATAASEWTCSIASQTVSCVNSTVLAGNSSYPSLTVTANVLQTAPSTVTNTAIVGGGGEVNLANDTATDIANVVSSADLSITNVASPDPVAAGSNITYTQVVTNNGPSAADNPTLTESVPANTTLVSIAAPSGWSCNSQGSGGTGNIVCTALTMAANTQSSFSIIVKVNSGVANGTVITDTATVSSAVSDPNIANNTASASTVVGTSSGGQLAVTNMVSPDPVAAGGTITYTQVVTNSGSAAVASATFSEPTPATSPATTLTFVSETPASGWTCSAPPVSCTDSSVPAGYVGTFTVVYSVSGTATSGTTITDTATVGPSTACGPCSATATDTVAPSTQATLALSTVATPSTVFPGNNITYTQTITNNGPAAATTPTFTEAIPANTTYVSVSAPAGWTCTVTASVVCNDSSNMAADTSADIIVVVNLAPSVTVASITANSSASASNSATSSTTVITPVSAACDMAVTDTGSPNPLLPPPATITYSQVVTNNGPSNCANATFTEAFPANTSFASMGTVPSGWTCTTTGSISCSDPSFAPNSPVTFAPQFTVTNTNPGTLISDTVTVATSTRDTNSANNTASYVIAVATGDAYLTITNTGTPNPVNAGQNITFAQALANTGPVAASTVTLADNLPANTTFVSLAATSGTGWTCTNTPPYQCTNPSLANGSSATFNFVVQVANSVANGTGITNTATVTTSSTNANPTNTASYTVYVADSADLSVSNSNSPIPVQAVSPNNNITYTQSVTNNGPSSATNVTFTQTTPPNTNFQGLTAPGTWACTHPTVGSTGTITCTISSLAPGTANFTLTLQVNSGTAAGTTINETASVSSSTTDPNPNNNSATASDVVATSTQADLVTTNTATPTTVAAGSDVTYNQSFTNLGPATATATVQFQESTPPNTNFQSITPPATGWSCTNPGVGNAGTITCTATGTIALNGSASFTLVLQVNSNTPSGTNIAETATATAGDIVPNLTTNSATATVVVANANSADMAIVKSASPNPTVDEGDTLTYSLAVTNNGPASATDVTVTDTLPSNFTYLSATATQGSCSEAEGTVTCLLGTMADAGTATVTIVTIPGAPGEITNTATVSADQTDPVPGNNTSSQTEIVTYPTAVRLQSFSAHVIRDKTGANRVALIWKTGGEAHNLGFNIYRERNGARVRLNPSLIAGSALLMRGALPKHSGKTYSWIDSSSNPGSGSYWLEDVDVNGARVLHGPVTAESSMNSSASSEAVPVSSALLNELQQSQPAASSNEGSHPVEATPREGSPTSAQRQKQFTLTAGHAVKIFVKHEGWYRLTQPELVKAGLDPNVDPTLLHLYAEAIEQPIQITGATAGSGGFGSQATIEFYGTGIDTPYSGTRVYWLVSEDQPGQRIQTLPPSSGSNQPPLSFPFTVELTPHTTYFAALLTKDGNNFFGPIISSTPTNQSIHVLHLDPNSSMQPKLELVLQGVILAYPHDVSVTLNGTTLGDVNFTGQSKGKFSASIPVGVLREGDNTVTLTSQGGEYDTSLIQFIRITYPHLYAADSDSLKFTGRAGDELNLTGFTSNSITVLDITVPDNPIELTSQITTESSSQSARYAVAVQVPWSLPNSNPTQHTLLAVALDRTHSPAGIRANQPSHWHSPQAGSDIVMISYPDFTAALHVLASAHQKEGKSSSVISVDDLYDEFNFGEHSPYAIRDFLSTARKTWSTKPHYLLLNGRASLDPRNYLGFGHLDLVPTMIIPASTLMTASDDWFSDFRNTGMPTIATGRLPVSTLEEAKLVAGKVAGYEGQTTDGAWPSQALMVADVNDTENFTQDAETVQSQIPSSIQVTDIFATGMNTSTVQQDIVNSINSGQLLVNYTGHGSEDTWSGSDFFNNAAADALTNGSSLPVFLIMDCLNGFFQDVYEQPLAVTLMLAPNGGAVAVLASSGLNQPAPQTNLDKLIVQNALHAPYPAIGDAILQAKSGISDISVRQTYNLLGDPAMAMKYASDGNSTRPSAVGNSQREH